MVIGRGAIQSPFDRFGAHSYEIVRESHCPVISAWVRAAAQRIASNRARRLIDVGETC